MYLVFEAENKSAKEFEGRVVGAFIYREAAEKHISAEQHWQRLDILEAGFVYEAQSYDPEWSWEKEPNWDNYVSSPKFFFISAENAEKFAKQYKFWNVRKYELKEKDCNDYVKPTPTLDDIFRFSGDGTA